MLRLKKTYEGYAVLMLLLNTNKFLFGHSGAFICFHTYEYAVQYYWAICDHTKQLMYAGRAFVIMFALIFFCLYFGCSHLLRFSSNAK